MNRVNLKLLSAVAWVGISGSVVAGAPPAAEKSSDGTPQHAADAHGAGGSALHGAALATSPLGTAGSAPLFEGLGDHRRPVTTKDPRAQRYFDQGLTLLWAFNHAEAVRSFREAVRLDPDCAMAWWGIAVAYGPNINKPMEPADNPKAWEALQKAQQAAAKPGVKDVERALVDALAKRYAEQPPADRAPLDKAYADAMAEVARRFPDDLDVAALYAEAVMDLTPWDYWKKNGAPKPGTEQLVPTLERVTKANPDHPGANHLLIHAVEAVEPARARQAADRLLRYAPAAGHLVHMPAHIYLRLGLYREAGLANELASAADESYIAQCNAQGFYPATYYPHNLHFLWYTNAMEGRSRDTVDAARKIEEKAARHGASEADRLSAVLPVALVRFGRWDEVLARPRPKPEQLYAAAMDHWTRGLAYAATDKLPEAEQELAALAKVAKHENAKSMDSIYLPGTSLVQVAGQDLAGHIALKKGNAAKAIEHLTAAVALDDELPYMEPPFGYLPMRHGLGAALLQAGKPAEAEAVYREDLKRNPHNGWSLLGLSQALRAQSKADAAKEVEERYELAFVRADVRPKASRYQ